MLTRSTYAHFKLMSISGPSIKFQLKQQNRYGHTVIRTKQLPIELQDEVVRRQKTGEIYKKFDTVSNQKRRSIVREAQRSGQLPH